MGLLNLHMNSGLGRFRCIHYVRTYTYPGNPICPILAICRRMQKEFQSKKKKKKRKNCKVVLLYMRFFFLFFSFPRDSHRNIREERKKEEKKTPLNKHSASTHRYVIWMSNQINSLAWAWPFFFLIEGEGGDPVYG